MNHRPAFADPPVADPPVAAPAPAPGPATVTAPVDRPRKMKRRKQEFSLSPQDLALIDVLIARARSVDHRARKSEITRAGIALLAELNVSRLVRALQALPTLRSRHK